MSHFLHFFLNKTLHFNVFCSVINEENGEIDRFIQLNPNSKDQTNQGDQFKSKGSRSYLI